MNIPLRARNANKKNHTSNPFKLANLLNIEVMYRPLGPLRGYFVRALRRKFIVLNSEFPHHIQRQTCAHEVEHALLHKGLGYFYIIKCTLFLLINSNDKPMNFPGIFFLMSKNALKIMLVIYIIMQKQTKSLSWSNTIEKDKDTAHFLQEMLCLLVYGGINEKNVIHLPFAGFSVKY